MSVLSEVGIRLGADPRSHGDFVALCEELAKQSHPARPDVDWSRVERLCLSLFQDHGVELQSAASFVLARTQLHGLDGLDDGVQLLRRLLGEGTVRFWPMAVPAREEILAWLFGQLQSVLRQLNPSSVQLPALLALEERTGQLLELLQPMLPLAASRLQALQQQLQGMRRRLTPAAPDALPAQLPAAEAEPAVIVASRKIRQLARRHGHSPAVVVLKLDTTDPQAPEEAGEERPIWLWAFLLMALIALACVIWATGQGGWSGILTFLGSSRGSAVTQPAHTASGPVHLDSLLLFPAGSAELKPEATKVLINGLIDIKAQPGWQIVITGHSDTSGDPRRNLELSRARAAAVRDWMQGMGDIPDGCFVVKGMGGEQPVADNASEEGRRANRRVDIELLPADGACHLPAAPAP